MAGNPPAAMREAHARAGRAREVRGLAQRADFPVFALAGAEGRLSAWGASGSRNRPDSFTVRHDPRPGADVEVTSERAEEYPEAPRALARDALEEVLTRELALGSLAEGSEVDFALRVLAHERAVHAQAARARPATRSIAVDGEPVEFALVEHEGRWGAAADHGPVTITVEARGVDPADVVLERVDVAGLVGEEL